MLAIDEDSMSVRPRRVLGVAAVAVALSGCGDLPTAPPRLDAGAAALVSPSVADARQRLAEGIVDPSMRVRVRQDLGQIELALARLDARAGAFRARLLVASLEDYASQPGAADRADAADLGAIAVAMMYLAEALEVGVNFDLLVPRA